MTDPTPRRQLNLFDSTNLILGIIVGVGIYQMTPAIAQGAGSAWGLLALWVLGGLISLCGALGYAELGTAYPRAGGDYVYLTRAFGPWAGFLFGWIQTVIVRPGDIAVLAFGFALYARQLWDPFATAAAAPDGAADAAAAYPLTQVLYASAGVVVLTVIHITGIRQGKWTQNVLTTVKILGLAGIAAVAVFAPARSGSPIEPVSGTPFAVALILVLFTFGGWNEMAYVAAEVKRPERNILRALVLGTVAVTVLYLLVNGAFLLTLGYGGVTASEAVAADAVASAFPDIGPRLISAIICISALGALSGTIFTGARISYAVGADHAAFRLLGRWDSKRGTPVRALLLQGVIAVTLIALVGGYYEAVLYTAPVVYCFYLGTSVALIVLRHWEAGVRRPYRIPLFPVPTLLFCGACGYLIFSAVNYNPRISGIAFVIALLGIPVYHWQRRGADEGGGDATAEAQPPGAEPPER